jgi:hypothetical protein
MPKIDEQQYHLFLRQKEHHKPSGFSINMILK